MAQKQFTVSKAGLATLNNGSGVYSLILKTNETLTANRSLTINLGDAARTLTFGGDFTTSGGNLTLNVTGSTSVTLPTSGTLVNSSVTTLSSLVSVGTITTGTWNGSVIAGQYGGTGVANTGKTITVSGNTVLGSSTHTVTLNTSNNTSVTLPTTGTLISSSSSVIDGLNSRIINVLDPTSAQDVATKAYVDSYAQGLNVHNPARVATTATLTATYSNGSSGVGATLTNSGSQAAISIDGVTLSLNDRVLVKDQSTQTQNGIYYVSTVGTVSTNWVLTRVTDFDNSPVGEVTAGDFLYVTEGSSNANKSYVMTTTGTITIGTSNIVFAQFSGSGTVTVTSPNLQIAGQTISLNSTLTNLTSVQTATLLGNNSLVIKPNSNSTTAVQIQNAAGTSIFNVDTTNRRTGIITTSPQTLLHIDGYSNTTTTSVADTYYGLGRGFYYLAPRYEVGTEYSTLSAAITTTGQTSISVTHAVFSNNDIITIDTENMQVTAGGGTTSLTVTRGYGSSTAATHNNGANVFLAGNAGGFTIDSFNNTASFSGRFSAGTPSSPAAPSGAGAYLTDFVAGLRLPSFYTNRALARFAIQLNETPTNTSASTGFVWESAASGTILSSGNVTMKLTSDPYLGIGTSAPVQRLHVSSGMGLFTSGSATYTTNDSAGAGLRIGYNSTNAGYIASSDPAGPTKYNLTLFCNTLSLVNNTGTLAFPNVNGTVITSADTGTVTSTMIVDGTIVNADINASAAIAVSKLAASTISGVTLGSSLFTLTNGTGLTWSTGTNYNGSAASTLAIDTATVATLSNIQTLTNKTLTAPSIDTSTTLKTSGGTTVATEKYYSATNTTTTADTVLISNLGTDKGYFVEVYVTNGTNYQMSSMHIVTDGASNTQLTEYAVVCTTDPPLVAFNADYSGGVRLLITQAGSVSHTYRVVVTSFV